MPNSPQPLAVLAYAGPDDAALQRFCRRLSTASMVVGVLLVVCNVLIVSIGFREYGVERAVRPVPPQLHVAYVLLLLDGVGSVVAGFYLVYAATLTRRTLPSLGLHHHRRWAMAKFQLAAIAAAGSMFAMGDAETYNSAPVGTWVLSILIQLAMSTAYPLTVMLLLRSQTLRRAW